MNSRLQQQMKKGVLEMLVLCLTENKEKYGYQMIQELKEKSNEELVLKEGTLYPILYRLEDAGFLLSRWSEAKGKETSRKFYVITEEGKKELSELKKYWKSFSEMVTDITEERIDETDE